MEKFSGNVISIPSMNVNLELAIGSYANFWIDIFFSSGFFLSDLEKNLNNKVE